MIYEISHIVNKHQEIHMAMDDNNIVGYYNVVNPSYAISHKETEIFTNMWTGYSSDFQTFYNNYVEDMKQFENVKSVISKPLKEKNIFTISCIPWTAFTGFNLNLQKDI